MGNKPLLCPSSRCAEGAILLGVVQEDGTISFVPDRVTVDRLFVETARKGRAPEKRFRFSTKCAKQGCAQWKGDRCGVIDEVFHYAKTEDAEAGSLPSCSIRSQCRWYAQTGPAACAVCSYVITDLNETDQFQK